MCTDNFMRRTLFLALSLAGPATLTAQQLLPVPPGTPSVPFVATSTPAANDEGITAPIALGFSWVAPGGAATTSVQATSNGRLTPAGTLTTTDPSPQPQDLSVGPQLCPLWSDLESANLFVDTSSPGVAVITWQDALYGPNPTTAFTFQVQLFADGSFVFAYDDRVAAAAPFALTGVASGVFPLVAETDFSDVVTGPIAVGALGSGAADFFCNRTCFQLPPVPLPPMFSPRQPFDLVPVPGATDAALLFFPVAGGYLVTGTVGTRTVADALEGREACPFPAATFDPPIDLFAATPPIIGTDFVVFSHPAHPEVSLLTYLYGFPGGLLTPPLDLGVFFPELVGCRVLTDIITPGALLGTVTAAPGQTVTIRQIPNLPALVGLSGLVVSALALRAPGSNLPVLFPTDELVITFGDL